MPRQVWRGGGPVQVQRRIYRGGAMVPSARYVQRGGVLVPTSATLAEGPVPVVASSTTAAQGANAADTPVTLPAGLAAGDLLLLAASVRTAGAVLTIPGWTTHPSAVMAGGSLTVGYMSRKVANASDAAALSGATVTLTSSVAVRLAARVARVTGARAVDLVGAGSGSGSGTTRTIGPITTVGTNRLLVGAWGTTDATITITKDPAMTEVGAQINSGGVATNHQALVVAVESLPAAGSTGTRSATLTASVTSAGQLLALAPVFV